MRPRIRRKGPLVVVGAALAALTSGCFSTAASTTLGSAIALEHPLVYTRFLPGADTGTVLRLDPGHTDPAVVRDGVLDYALLSPDGTRFTTFAPTSDDRGSACVFTVAGADFRVLEIPDPTLELPGGVWSSGTRRLVGQGFDATDASRTGLYSRRVSDGGDLVRLTDPGSRVDWPVSSSPDGRHVLFFRPHPKGETSDSAPQDAFVVGADGGPATRLTPPGATTAFAFGAATATWSPDSRQVAVATAEGPFWDNPVHRVYVVDVDGARATPVGPRGEIWDAAWSPDGRWIAFSMKKAGRFDLYLMHPDGTAVRQLTPSTGVQSSMAPSWSPDSRQLVFHRWTDDPRVGDLWAIDADGTHLTQLTHQQAGYGSGPGLAWLP